MRVITVLGTRPEIIRLSRVIALLNKNVEHILVHTGQNYDYELNKIFFDDLELRAPDHFLDAVGKSVAETIGNIVTKIDSVLEREKPHAFLVLGDTNSCLSALAAKKRKIPIFHMEAGNRCFDQRVPEETNRKIVDHIADINLPYSSISREYLLREGLPPDCIVKTGSPMKEVISHYMPKIERSPVLREFNLDKGKYIVVSSHREENVDDDGRLGSLVKTLNILAARFDVPLIMSTHPRTRKRLESKSVVIDPRIRLLTPLSFSDYVRLQMSALVTLSDSGTITEECSLLGFPAVNLREAHERPEGMEEAAVPLAGLEPEGVLQCVEMVVRRKNEGRPLHVVDDYDVDNVSEKVLNVILSYTDYVNRNVWRKGLWGKNFSS
jgi:UDP-N-acetylglucosamine 2-epimerase (non-hydrolysing)